ncbi:MAG: acyltransferase [Anaeromyxobacter sp.]
MPLSTLKQLARSARGWLPLAGRARLPAEARVLGRVWFHGGGRVVAGPGARVEAGVLPVELHVERGAVLVIGAGAVLRGGTSIEVTERVEIGANVRLGRLCKVLDNAFHEPRGDRNGRPASRPVVIGDGAVIGDRAILLPGAVVAPGAVIPRGAVVRPPPRREEGGTATGRTATAPLAGGPPPGSVRRIVQLAVSDPAAFVEALRSRARALLVFEGPERGPGVRVRGPVRVERHGTVRVGARATFMRGMLKTRLAAGPGALVAIGEGTVLNYGVEVEARTSVTLGDRCLVGSHVRLVDHGGGRSGPIAIEDGVWIAHGVTVLPGVRIGRGSVVAAGSLVCADVPPGSFAAGRPARVRPLAAGPGAQFKAPGTTSGNAAIAAWNVEPSSRTIR